MQDEPTDLQQVHQGCSVPCVDCTILYGHREDCARCNGVGSCFEPAQMCDQSIQWERGCSDREYLAELREAASWEKLADLIHGCFLSYVIYGQAWVVGFLELAPRGDAESWPDSDEAIEAWKKVEPALKSEFHAALAKADR